MKIDGKFFPTLDVFPSMMTVPDCVVVSSNKIGTGHGEAKFYIASKDVMYDFYGNETIPSTCFLLKKDLLAYMEAIKHEYLDPSQEYRHKDELPLLWEKRKALIESQNEVIEFKIHAKTDLKGNRGYIKASKTGFELIRQIALPLVSYIYVEKVGTAKEPLFYWKLFVDFDAIWEKKNGPLVLTYGKLKTTRTSKKAQGREQKKTQSIRQAREGQGKYREDLLKQCHICPFTGIADERLLIASHIKPWAACSDQEKIDPFNGYILSPLYDKLFDKGFITFTPDRHVILSDFISARTWKQINLKKDTFLQFLPMDEKRVEYLKFHHKHVFKGFVE